MSMLSPDKCISPLKLKRKKKKSYDKELISSPKSSISLPAYQHEKEQRARAIIIKLLDDEAERNEELGEENHILETQIKSLVLLLVEKDEKLSSLKLPRHSMNKEQNYASVLHFQLLSKKAKERLNFGLKRIRFYIFYVSMFKISNKTKIKILKDIGNRIIKRWPLLLFKKIKQNLTTINSLIRKKLEESFHSIIYHLNFIALRKKAKIVPLLFKVIFKANIKSILRCFLNNWKKLLAYKEQDISINLAHSILNLSKTPPKIGYQKRFLPISITFIINLEIQEIFYTIMQQSSFKKLLLIKARQKNFLTDFTKNSKRSISFNSLNSIISRKNIIFTLRLFQKWKMARVSSIKIIYFIESLTKVLKRVFSHIFKVKTSLSLAYSIRSRYMLRLTSSFYMLKLYAVSQHTSEFSQEIEYLAESSADINESIIKCKNEISVYSNKCNDLRSELSAEEQAIENLKQDIFKANSFYKELLEKANKQNSYLDSFSDKTSSVQAKFSQENHLLQEKIRKQQDFFKTANLKLQQLVDRYEQIISENQMIASKNEHIQNSIKKLHESYSSILEEKLKTQHSETESKLELSSLQSTCQAFNDEIHGLKSSLKNSSSQLSSLKEEFAHRMQSLDEIKDEVENYQVTTDKLLSEVHELEIDINTEFEVKELKINECGIEIQTLREQYEKSKEEIENIKSQIKEKNNKAKTKKAPGDIRTLTRRLEETKASLVSIKTNISSVNEVISSSEHEISEVESGIQTKCELYEKKKSENRNLENKISQLARAIQESKKITQRAHKSKEDLKSYIRTLENQTQQLKNAASRQASFDIGSLQSENEVLAIKAAKLEKELSYVNEEAAQRRQEVAQIMPEIENYANILAAIEGKIAENEGKIADADEERDRARSEIKALRSRYLTLISELR